MRPHIIALFETIAQVITLLLEPFQFQTRKREQELALERLKLEHSQNQLEAVLEHTAAMNSDATTAMLKVAEGFQGWLELFKTHAAPEALAPPSDEEMWREEQIKMRASYRAQGLNVPAEPEASLYAYDQRVGEEGRGADDQPVQFSLATQAYLDSLYEMRRAG